MSNYNCFIVVWKPICCWSWVNHTGSGWWILSRHKWSCMRQMFDMDVDVAIWNWFG